MNDSLTMPSGQVSKQRVIQQVLLRHASEATTGDDCSCYPCRPMATAAEVWTNRQIRKWLNIPSPVVVDYLHTRDLVMSDGNDAITHQDANSSGPLSELEVCLTRWAEHFGSEAVRHFHTMYSVVAAAVDRKGHHQDMFIPLHTCQAGR